MKSNDQLKQYREMSETDLKERYGAEVPVLLINGRKAFKYRVTVRELKKKLS